MCIDGLGPEVPNLRDLEQLLLEPEVQRSVDARGVCVLMDRWCSGVVV